jgi:alpha-aminoadipic semialdehyde synthase
MTNRIGLRLEDKNPWERRVALTPEDVAHLNGRGFEIHVERFPRRTFPDTEYASAGAKLTGDVRPCELVLGIKEMPREYFREGGAYMFFSHTIKGQSFNMEMLRALVERRCTLLDYETVTDENGRRLIFFGRHAGLAGMIDTLWTLGRRLDVLGHPTALLDLGPAHTYADLHAAEMAVASAGRRLAAEGVPALLRPMVFGFTGYGNVSRGAQDVFDLMPHVEVAPGDLAAFVAANRGLSDRLVKVVYREEHLVRHAEPGRPFELQDYYANGGDYVSIFEPHLGLLSALVNCIYWDERYPKLADAGQLRALFAGGPPRLCVVGDISCDVDGSLACTVRDTNPGDPVYVYDPATGAAPSGFEGPGLAVMAVGNLPCELPREASLAFSTALMPFVPALAGADLGAPLGRAGLPGPIERSVILWRGEFAPRFEYMRGFLQPAP